MKNEKYEAVIGLEIHIQLNTKTKAFCRCSTNYKDLPNTNICPVCTGQPGALPVFNKEVINKALQFSLALNSDINLTSTFDRKNYFYPDMPKNYQITQFFTPIAENGYVIVTSENNERKKVGIERVHMEEDTAKSIHLDDDTLINFNRAGIPLIEVVSRPDMRSGKEAADYFKKIYLSAVKYLGICNGIMEEGNLRCDANVSIRPKGSTELFTKAEVKNVNSFSFIQKAIEYEIQRQIELVESGGKVEPETRLWNSKAKKTETMRKKGGLTDYRYFNEPDLGILEIKQELVDEIKSSLPEMPDAKEERFFKDYDLNAELVEFFINYPQVADYFEKSAKIYMKGNKKIASWITSELLNIHDKEKMETLHFTPEMMAELVKMIDERRITQVQAKEVLAISFEEKKSPAEVVEQNSKFAKPKDLDLDSLLKEVLKENESHLERYLAGKEALFGFFVGQMMKKTKGQADPVEINKILKKELTKLKNS